MTTIAPTIDADPASQVAAAQRALDEWLRTCWQQPLATFHVDGQPAFMPTCFAVLAAEFSGLLRTLGKERRREIADALLAFQREETGLFEPGTLRRKELTSHSATYLRFQATYFAIHALDALDQRPRHEIRVTGRLCNIDYLRGWLDGGPWGNPWLHSNNIMFALTFLQHRHATQDDPAALRAFDALLAYLDDRQDAATGLWQPDEGVDLANGMYAAYHFFPYYFWRGVRPRHVERIIDSSLAVQHRDGLFGIGRGGGACEDLDAVHALVMMSLISGHRREDVDHALRTCLHRILIGQNPDGGFPNRLPPLQKKHKSWKAHVRNVLPMPERPAPQPVWYHSGWRLLSCPRGASDMWSAWFRPLAAQLIVEHLGHGSCTSLPPSYRRLPGLGWHDPARIERSQRETDTTGSSPDCVKPAVDNSRQ